MSMDLHLYCRATNERVPALRSGNTTTQQLDANAMASFLAYHAALELRGSREFVLRDSSSDDLDESVLWTESNYRELLAREPKVLSGQDEFENAPSGGIWVRRTVEGRII